MIFLIYNYFQKLKNLKLVLQKKLIRIDDSYEWYDSYGRISFFF